MAIGDMDSGERDVLVGLIQKLQQWSETLEDAERELLDRVLLEFFLQSETTGERLLDSVGTEDALQRLRDFIETSSLGDEIDDQSLTSSITSIFIGS